MIWAQEDKTSVLRNSSHHTKAESNICIIVHSKYLQHACLELYNFPSSYHLLVPRQFQDVKECLAY